MRMGGGYYSEEGGGGGGGGAAAAAAGSSRYVHHHHHHHHHHPELHLHSTPTAPSSTNDYNIPFPLLFNNFSSNNPNPHAHHHHHHPLRPIHPPPDNNNDNNNPTAVSSFRRPRGRPPGSRNKPKPPIILTTRDSPNLLSSHILEVSPSADILHTLSTYARRRGRGLIILSASGTVASVSLCHPAASPPTDLHGRFEILSLTGTVLPPPAPPQAGGLSIFLAGAQGQVVGGTVVGPLVASGPVILMAASFSNAVFERLPDDQDDQEELGTGGVQVQPTASQSSGVTGGGGGGGRGKAINERGGPLVDVGGGGNSSTTTTTANTNNSSNSSRIGGAGGGYPLLFAADLFGWGGSSTTATAPKPPQF